MLAKIEIDGVVYTDGESVHEVRKNYLIFGFDYDVQFYGYHTETEEPVFKHFLTVWFFWKRFNWTFRTSPHSYQLPYIN